LRLGRHLGVPPKATEARHASGDLSRVARMLARSRKVMVVTGAGISASCGIPTFRGAGDFYDTVAREFGLPDGHAVMDINFFNDDPRPFFKVAKRLYPSNYEPSRTHKFIKNLESAGLLLRDYTQNVDTLERSAGIKRVVYCHGSFSSATCTQCRAKYDGQDVEEKILDGRVPKCNRCKEEYLTRGVIKPDITFFHESLPDDFYNHIKGDLHDADLLLVMGTSLSVAPVSYIPLELRNVPSIFINAEQVDQYEGIFDVFVEGACDAAIAKLQSHGLEEMIRDQLKTSQGASDSPLPRKQQGAESAEHTGSEVSKESLEQLSEQDSDEKCFVKKEMRGESDQDLALWKEMQRVREKGLQSVAVRLIDWLLKENQRVPAKLKKNGKFKTCKLGKIAKIQVQSPAKKTRLKQRLWKYLKGVKANHNGNGHFRKNTGKSKEPREMLHTR